jgi:hypothetical protein
MTPLTKYDTADQWPSKFDTVCSPAAFKWNNYQTIIQRQIVLPYINNIHTQTIGDKYELWWSAVSLTQLTTKKKSISLSNIFFEIRAHMHRVSGALLELFDEKSQGSKIS